MKIRRKLTIAISVAVVVAFIAYTTYSGYTEPKALEPQYIKNSKPVVNSAELLPGDQHYSVLVKSGKSSAEIYLSFQNEGLFNPMRSTTNISGKYYIGMYMGVIFFTVSYANASISGSMSAFSFYLTNYSFQTNYPYLLMPLHTSPYYTSTITIVNGKTITPSHGFFVGSNIPFFNYTGLYNQHTFWLNMTINPFVSYGPYYAKWNPVSVSLWWTENIAYVD